MSVQLHHVALVVAEPERSAEFYESIFGLTRLDRPPFKIEGVWLDCGPGLQLHLTRHPQGTFRSGGVDNNDGHFAFRTDDFEGILARLVARGFREDAPEDDPMRILVNRSGMAGFLQLYVLDPDRNIIEVNTAAGGPF
ncbi:lactoylglutathione lyase [Devosia sp. Root413D1]|uniref:VOC family protein n=1 Tax=Devosia sp. Root413D1 TaxID=1736531 RepID=UPI0006F63C2A|nr:VOC family protein [Devosia sp. Root413D1]KQW77673.1 lactoylglutathione lyase [Devosia sp. Root413D1]